MDINSTIKEKLKLLKSIIYLIISVYKFTQFKKWLSKLSFVANAILWIVNSSFINIWNENFSDMCAIVNICSKTIEKQKMLFYLMKNTHFDKFIWFSTNFKSSFDKMKTLNLFSLTLLIAFTYSFGNETISF
jgi:hypothetical protein